MTIKWWRAGALVTLAAWAATLMPATAQTPPGIVAGTVMPLEWAQEVEVCAVETQPSETCTVPRSNGSYSLVVPLGDVRIEFAPSIRSGLLTQYYDEKSLLREATTIHLMSSQPAATEIDASLVEGGAVEGTVTATGTALPLAEVEVCALSMSSAALKRCGETDAAGVYELPDLPDGSYKVVFRGRGKNAEYESIYYDGRQTFAQATSVGVTAGAKTSGIDAVLEKGARIKGSVTEAGGGALAGIPICLFEPAAAAPERCTYSDDAGTYSFEGLSSGSYQIGFSLEPGEIGGSDGEGNSEGFETQYFNGVTSRVQAATISVFAPTLVSGVDASLSRPPEPAAVISPPPVAAPIVAAPPVVPEPKPTVKRCRKGFRKQKVKGRMRCVKMRKVSHRHHRRKHAHRKTKGKTR